MQQTQVGWIGLGNMGNPMSEQLLKAGYPLTVFNRSKNKQERLISKGARSAGSPAEVARNADVVFIMVSDDTATASLFTGENGLLSTPVMGRCFVNMSTVSPGISKELAQLCSRHGSTYLDAPVSGSVKQAIEAQLVIMVGGDQEQFNRVKPLLDCLGKLCMRIGEVGAGNTAKLAINTLLAIHAQGLAEAVVFAHQHEIETNDLLELLNAGAMANPFMKIKGEALAQQNYQAAFALKHIAKDLRLAKGEGLNTPLANVASETFQQAEAKFANDDIIAIRRHFENI